MKKTGCEKNRGKSVMSTKEGSRAGKKKGTHTCRAGGLTAFRK